MKRLSAELAVRLQATSPDTIWDEVTVVLSDDEGIRQTNRAFFGKDRPTDVISFRYDPVPGETGCSGDILVNVQCAVHEGPSHGGANAELALYIAHGFNHLSGATDDTPARRAAMRRRETQWLASIPPNDLPLFAEPS